MPQAPIFEAIFGKPLAELPPVMQKHYAIRPDSTDRVIVSGTMNIRRNWVIRLLSPFLKLFGALVPYAGSDIPVTVNYFSGRGEQSFHYDRLFHIKGRPVHRFHSRVKHLAGREAVEIMRGGISWRCTYEAAGNQIRLRHKGYVWHIGGFLLPLPLTWILGKGASEEEALTEDTFRMWMTMTHPIFGENYHYEGTFKVTEMTLEQ